jgi:hypothetical protein
MGKFSREMCLQIVAGSHIGNCDDLGSSQGFYCWGAMMPHCGKFFPCDDHNSKIKKRERARKTPKFGFLMN